MTTYRTRHILVKHEESARLASWRDPDGEYIKARTVDQAEETLRSLRLEVQTLQGAAQIYARFAALAREHSDCASAKKGGDLGVLEAGDMDEGFEQAAWELSEGGVSDVVRTDSGCHIVLRVPLELEPAAFSGTSSSTAVLLRKSATASALPATPPAAIPGVGAMRASHILVKHKGSSRLSSWRDPTGDEIRFRAREAAARVLELMRVELSKLSPELLLDEFDQLARTESDSGTYSKGGPRAESHCLETRVTSCILSLHGHDATTPRATENSRFW